MNRLSFAINQLSQVLLTFDRIKVYRDTTEGCGFTTEITTSGTRPVLIPEQRVYYFTDDTGVSSDWYKIAFFKDPSGPESAKSAARQASTEEEKIGYSFRNYAPPPDEWGEMVTADDMRYTYLFGIDAVAQDAKMSAFQDEQFRYFVEAAVDEFESLLTIDIRKRVYKTNPDSALIRSPEWRTGVDYTNEEDSYIFDPQQWQNFGMVPLRHTPVLSIERAVLNSLVTGEVIDLKKQNWIRLDK